VSKLFTVQKADNIVKVIVVWKIYAI